MVARMHVSASVLAWAVRRSGLDEMVITDKFPRYQDWRAQGAKPTLKELEQFAQLTRTPLGYLFLPDPPTEQVPIQDFRTWGNARIRQPSPDLMDTIYDCQMRQSWYSEYAQGIGHGPLPFVGSVSIERPATEVAALIRDALDLDAEARGKWSAQDEAWRWLYRAIEALGVLVMVNGVVGNNTHRKLNASEFRGFSMSDEFAPVIFVNGADSGHSKAPQVFTLVHELAHIWAGDSGISDADISNQASHASELWANKVAAEVLVPSCDLARLWKGAGVDELQQLRQVFRVSTLVILKKAVDDGLLAWSDYEKRYGEEWDRIRGKSNSDTASSGGNYYNAQPYRVSRRLARAVVANALEGQTLFSEAYSLLGARKHSTFLGLAEVVMS